MIIDHVKAAEILSQGQIVALPSETVYGLAGSAYHEQAIAHIYHYKKRPLFNPLIVHYPDVEHTLSDVVWNDDALRLADALWPGPLTLILPRSAHSRIVPAACANLDSVAVRVPQHPLFQRILHDTALPLAAPSANPSGMLSATHVAHVLRFFPHLAVVDGGECLYGMESTIVDCRTQPFRILRWGATDVSVLESVLKKNVLTQYHDTQIIAPGMMRRHYAPSKPLRLHATHVEMHEGLLAFGPPLSGAAIVFQLSEQKEAHFAAQRLFQGLHYLDQDDCCSAIAVMPIPDDTGIGKAIHDRLQRAVS